MIEESALPSTDPARVKELPPWLLYSWTVGQAAALACALEASAPKAGNVHPTAAFRDMQFIDFLASGCAIGPVLDSVSKLSIGELVLAGVQATREAVELNTNLGTLLLLAPLGKAVDRCRPIDGRSAQDRQNKPSLADLRIAVKHVLNHLTADDSRCVYEAIRLADPSGLGSRPNDDIGDTPPKNLLSAMSQVADIDAVARQYVNGFSDILDNLTPWLIQSLRTGDDVLESVCRTHVRWLAFEPDGLIVRKSGIDIGLEAQRLSQLTLHSMARAEEDRDPGGLSADSDVASDRHAPSIVHSQEYSALDSFLRADGNRRNPGTTADLLAASLFVLLVADWSYA